MTKDETRKAIHFKKPKSVPLKTEDFLPDAFEKHGDKLWNLLNNKPGKGT